MNLRPCLHCRHREGCPIRADLIARVQAAGLSGKLGAVNFRCPERWRGLEIGREVDVALWHFWPPESTYDGEGLAEWEQCDPIRGVVVEHLRDGRAALWLDEPTSLGKVRIRLHPDYPGLIPLDTMREVCKDCGRPEGVAMLGGERGVWFCDSCGESYTPAPPPLF